MSLTTSPAQIEHLGEVPAAYYTDYLGKPRDPHPLEAGVSALLEDFSDHVNRTVDMEHGVIHENLPGLDGIRNDGGHSSVSRALSLQDGRVLRTDLQGVDGLRGRGEALWINYEGILMHRGTYGKDVPMRKNKISLIYRLPRLHPTKAATK